MAGRPPYQQSNASSTDPFADRPRQIAIQEPSPRAYESTVSLTGEGDGSSEGDFQEKQPLAAGQPGFAGGFYPPGFVFDRYIACARMLIVGQTH